MEKKSIGVINVPKGKVLKDFRFFCPKHGDITNASIAIKSDYIKPDGTQVISPNVFCIACLNEYLEKLQQEGFFPTIAVVPVIGENEEDGKLVYEKSKNIRDLVKNIDTEKK